MWQSLWILNVFNTLTLKQVFWKPKIFLKELEYRYFSSEYYEWNRNISIQNCPAKSKMANRMGSTKWTYHKEWAFATDYFIFLKIWFEYKNLLEIVDLTYQLSKYTYSYFSRALQFYLRVCSPCEYTQYVVAYVYDNSYWINLTGAVNWSIRKIVGIFTQPCPSLNMMFIDTWQDHYLNIVSLFR